jgi:Repeat of unknown function (DUF6923)
MRNHSLSRALILAAICVSAMLSIAGTVSAQTPFACTGEAYIIQDASAQLTEIDQTTTPFTFVPIGGAAGFEINNLGFNRADGLLYAVRLTAAGNTGILTIDSTGTLFGPVAPVGLPTTSRFAAGDIHPSGSPMYLNTNGVGTLYKVTLPAMAVSSVAITGATGTVFDWALNPTDGLLYGGDQTGGQLAVLNPTTGVRTDSAVGGGGLPTGTAYGGAWFNAAGRLFLYRNNGTVYEIDVSGPTIVGTQSGPGSTNNDGAACIQDIIGVGKHMSHPSAGFPDPITIDYTFENLSGTDTLSSLSAIDDLTAVFGERGTAGNCAAPTPATADWFFTSIAEVAPMPGTFINASYNGDTVTQLINQAPTQSLVAGATQTVRVMITLCNQENATPPNPPGTGGPPYLFFNSVLFTGQNPSGATFGDISNDDGTTTPDPDPDMNGSPDERVPAQVPVELMEFSVD